jgi:hypothetical protein
LSSCTCSQTDAALRPCRTLGKRHAARSPPKMDPSHIPPFSCLQQMMAGGLAGEFDLTGPVSLDGSQSEFSAAGRVLASKTSVSVARAPRSDEPAPRKRPMPGLEWTQKCPATVETDHFGTLSTTFRRQAACPTRRDHNERTAVWWRGAARAGDRRVVGSGRGATNSIARCSPVSPTSLSATNL